MPRAIDMSWGKSLIPLSGYSPAGMARAWTRPAGKLGSTYLLTTLATKVGGGIGVPLPSMTKVTYGSANAAFVIAVSTPVPPVALVAELPVGRLADSARRGAASAARPAASALA